MSSIHRIRLSDTDSRQTTLVISARLSDMNGTTSIFRDDGYRLCRTIRIHDLGDQSFPARTKVLLENRYANGRLRREWVRIKDSIDDLRHVFTLAGQDMPPVTRSFLSRLRDIKSFVTILR